MLGDHYKNYAVRDSISKKWKVKINAGQRADFQNSNQNLLDERMNISKFSNFFSNISDRSSQNDTEADDLLIKDTLKKIENLEIKLRGRFIKDNI